MQTNHDCYLTSLQFWVLILCVPGFLPEHVQASFYFSLVSASELHRLLNQPFGGGASTQVIQPQERGKQKSNGRFGFSLPAFLL